MCTHSKVPPPEDKHSRTPQEKVTVSDMNSASAQDGVRGVGFFLGLAPALQEQLELPCRPPVILHDRRLQEKSLQAEDDEEKLQVQVRKNRQVQEDKKRLLRVHHDDRQMLQSLQMHQHQHQQQQQQHPPPMSRLPGGTVVPAPRAQAVAAAALPASGMVASSSAFGAAAMAHAAIYGTTRAISSEDGRATTAVAARAGVAGGAALHAQPLILLRLLHDMLQHMMQHMLQHSMCRLRGCCNSSCNSRIRRCSSRLQQ